MRAVDLFSGCGGLSLGFLNAGFEIAAAFELWEDAVKCCRENFSHPVIRQDLTDTESSALKVKAFSPDIIIGGPPCQDFSSAGKREENARAGLTVCFARIVKAAAPEAFLMENVPRVQKSAAYGKAREILREAGYGLTEIVLDASRCGVPQRRKRFFCFGVLGEKDGFARDLFEAGLSDAPLTVRGYFGADPDFEFYYRHPRSYQRRAVFSVDEPAPTMRGVNRPIPKGYPGHPGDACHDMSRVHVLTTRERALIQTFPPAFKWSGSKTSREQLIGNAVPVKLAEYVAMRVSEYFRTARREGKKRH